MINKAALEKTKRDLEIGIQETLLENPDVNVDDIWFDLVIAFAHDLDDDTAREWCRINIGLIPQDLKYRLGETDWVR